MAHTTKSRVKQTVAPATKSSDVGRFEARKEGEYVLKVKKKLYVVGGKGMRLRENENCLIQWKRAGLVNAHFSTLLSTHISHSPLKPGHPSFVSVLA